MESENRPLEINQKTITGPARLTTIWPKPHIPEATELVKAGPVTIGVEYRYLKTADPEEGVSLHVFGHTTGEMVEHVRFDCFEEGPHYHYMDWSKKSQVGFPMDRTASGDPLEWSLICLKNRIAPMLELAGAHDVARQVERHPKEVQAALPKVAAAARKALARVASEQASAGASQTARAHVAKA